MGAFYLVQRNKHRDEGALRERLEASLRRQGFGPSVAVSSPSVSLAVFGKINVPGENIYRVGDNDWAASVGTLVCDGRVGQEALKAVFDRFTPPAPDWHGIYGHFCLIVCKAGTVYVIQDRIGTYKVYASADRGVVSSSFLAVAAATDPSSLSDQEVYEYVFQGATYGTGTIVEGIEILDSSAVWSFGSGVNSVPVRTRGGALGARPTFEERIEASLVNLRAYFARIASSFERIDTALSGGYDSRLCLALLREQGVTPRLHVYGSDRDPDVRVAKTIAAGEALALEVIDKSQLPKVEVRDFPDIVERNFWSFDGYPSDGVFDNGSDLETRLNRCVNGELMLNGGGGEIFRNFFYLPDRRYRARDLLWTFYSQFDPKVCTGVFSERGYLARLEAKLLAAIGADGEVLSREQVEAAYPMFRCRFWMGRNNSLNNRFGWALTPFAEYDIVKDAVPVPIGDKNFGAFEARLIEETDSRLAGYASVYGHDFIGKPPLRRVLQDMGTLIRPPLLRRFSYRWQTRMKPLSLPYFLEPSYLQSVIDPGFPVMSRFFDIGRIKDAQHYRRICTLEYLAARLSLH